LISKRYIINGEEFGSDLFSTTVCKTAEPRQRVAEKPKTDGHWASGSRRTLGRVMREYEGQGSKRPGACMGVHVLSKLIAEEARARSISRTRWARRSCS